MAEKIYVENVKPPNAGPNSRVRMGEHVIAVLDQVKPEESDTQPQEVPSVN